jgi:hypothetical protein
MAASIERIRRSMKVEPTPQNRGLTLSLTIKAYDNDKVEVDGHLMAGSETEQWLAAAEVAAITLTEFRRQFEQRRRTDAA